MNNPTPKVDGYIRKSKLWQEELRALRQILLDSPLTEEVKWRAPCYTIDGRNIILLGRFKESCVISFLKGALLKDPHKILVKPGENSQSARFVRFTDVQRVHDLEPVLRSYILQSIAIERAGLKVQLKKPSEHPLPQEFQDALKKSPALKTAFSSLTPGRQRAYLLHFSSAKQSKTRHSRIDKCTPKILAGQGFDD
jgi:uncharacterized protein YdeI (YjbR/CyaY-like superfamily)